MGKIKLTELEPGWVSENGNRYAIHFNCPIQGCPIRNIVVPFKIWSGYNPEKHHIWTKTGDVFETLTLMPSVDATRTKQGVLTGCLFHGYITNGEVTW